jgi:hypothetical protein
VKLTEKQKLCLLITLRDSIPISNCFSITRENRERLLTDIVEQQDEPSPEPVREPFKWETK